MKAVFYTRVSTDKQHTENQADDLNLIARIRGLELVQVYSEDESAWHAGHQKELSRLLADAHKGKFQVVLVWSLDRLTREGSLAILSLVQKLKQYGVKVVSAQEPWTEAPGELGELLYAITGWVARMESQRRSERVKIGLAGARRRGSRLGRPKGRKDSHKRQRRRLNNGTQS